MKIEKIYDCLNMTRGQLVLIACFVSALEFFLNLWILRTEYTPDPNVFINYAGFPFEAIKITNLVTTGWYYDVGTIVHVTLVYECLWGGIIMNLIIYIALSAIIVKSATWIRDEIEYRRYCKA